MVDTNSHVKSTELKLTIFLTEGTGLAEEMNQAIRTGISPQIVLLSHIGAVEARVYPAPAPATPPPHPNYKENCGNHRVESPTSNTCCRATKSQITNIKTNFNFVGREKLIKFLHGDPLSTISATRPKVTHGHQNVMQAENVVVAA